MQILQNLTKFGKSCKDLHFFYNEFEFEMRMCVFRLQNVSFVPVTLFPWLMWIITNSSIDVSWLKIITTFSEHKY